MHATRRNTELADRYRAALAVFLSAEAIRHGSTAAVNPGHRVPFQWPPHPVSYNYHVLASDWRGTETVEIHGEPFEVKLAYTPHGVFGRCEALWAEARGKTLPEMLDSLRATVEPLFRRQETIAECLGSARRFDGPIKELPAEDLLKLLYCPDRDVANDARIVLETRPGKPDLLPALLEILRDERHPHRRSAQWCVLDLFEDLPSYCTDPKEEAEAVSAIRDLIWSAEDDYARTIYKAGVVLGGHLPGVIGGPALIECLGAPSKIGRRAAIHGLFHVAEWDPEVKSQVVAALRQAAQADPEPQLREYAELMARDIEAGEVDHVAEPVFADEK